MQLSRKVNKHQVECKRSWFTDELRRIKERTMECRRLVSEESTVEAVNDLKYWKTKFRRIQRRNSRMQEKHKYKTI